eukprot:gnl/TRDRNA2_/TRDRNA2_86843_c0_seq1.p1 gnl/TRDRNA2_/TRDRNA2_86843_c0~~gnl/TRDRNA2_/TRDRNA2_86843_c0_seq1.p1  ORF type:complete len:181 (-),score=32.38 gnl/TRDRNA2_/TRDRNA2_86843_c0_seq1:11-505(-)
MKGVASRSGRVISHGDHWGADLILNDDRLLEKTFARSLAYSEVLALSREAIDSVVDKFPEWSARIRWEILRLTWLRVFVPQSRRLRALPDFQALPEQERIRKLRRAWTSFLGFCKEEGLESEDSRDSGSKPGASCNGFQTQIGTALKGLVDAGGGTLKLSINCN